MMIIYTKHILSNVIKNTINWNNAISNLRGQLNDKILQLTEHHVVSQFKNSLISYATH